MLSVNNWVTSLQTAVADATVGISIAKISGDENFSLYITKIPPLGRVGAHFHQEGSEMYLIESGNGTIFCAPSERPNNITKRIVTKSDVFTIQPGQIHQLVNNSSSEPLILIFGCVPSHLDHDRVISEDLFNHN